MFHEELLQQVSQFPDGTLVVRIADIDDLVLADIVAVFQNAEQRRNAVVDIGKAPFLAAAVHKADRPFHQELGDELRHHPGAAFLCRIQGIQAGSDPVEGSEQREFQMPPRAVGIDHPIEELLAAGVDPALLLDRPHDQITLILLELRIGARPVHLRGRGKNDALVILDALFDHIEIHFEIEVVDADRVFHVELGRRNRDERKDNVALLDVILDPLPVDRDIPFDKMKARILQVLAETVVGEVHPVNDPVRLVEDPLCQMVADKPVNPQDQNLHDNIIPSLSVK